jgi:hypothetical protein
MLKLPPTATLRPAWCNVPAFSNANGPRADRQEAASSF